jgi:hypothetical protein
MAQNLAATEDGDTQSVVRSPARERTPRPVASQGERSSADDRVSRANRHEREPALAPGSECCVSTGGSCCGSLGWLSGFGRQLASLLRERPPTTQEARHRMLQTTAGAHGRNVPGWYGSTAYSGHSSHARAAPGDRWVPVSVNTLTRLLNDLEPARHPVRGRIWARIQHHKRPEPALELSS